jgi:hypothetical protein
MTLRQHLLIRWASRTSDAVSHLASPAQRHKPSRETSAAFAGNLRQIDWGGWHLSHGLLPKRIIRHPENPARRPSGGVFSLQLLIPGPLDCLGRGLSV